MGTGGFTLVELTIVIVVVSISALAFTAMFQEAVRSYAFVSSEKDLLQEARYAEERMVRELMNVGRNGRVRVTRPTAVAFLDRDSSTVGFSWSGTRGGDLLYVRDGVARTLAAGVDSFALAYYPAKGSAAWKGAGRPLERIAFFLRLARGGQSVDAVGSACLRSL